MTDFGYRIFPEDRIFLRTISSVAVDITGNAVIEFDNGKIAYPSFPVTSASDRTVVSSAPFVSPKRGTVVGAYVDFMTPVLKRGQCYVSMPIQKPSSLRPRQLLLAGYLHNEFNVPMGFFEPALSGKGALDWVQEGNDVAGNVVATVNLAVSDARRIVRGVIVKYHQVGGSAATITITLRDLADSGGPTNWSIDSDTWVSPDLVLGANEEGLIHIGEHGFLSTNDAGTLAYADNTTAPNPFPLTVEAGDPVDLLIAASGGASGDDYDVWVQYEEWIEA